MSAVLTYEGLREAFRLLKESFERERPQIVVLVHPKDLESRKQLYREIGLIT